MEKLTKHWLDGSRVLTSGVVVGGGTAYSKFWTVGKFFMSENFCPEIWVWKVPL